MSAIIPNSFQTPNAHVDMAMQYLTGDEYKVLNFATRHILGWQDRVTDRSGAISLSTFQNGWNDFGGCGLSKPAIIKALDTLHEFGLLVKLGKPDQKGQRYSIGLEPDWTALKARTAARAQSNRKRTEKARSLVGGQSDSTSTVPLTTGGQSDNTTGGQSDSTHTKPLSKPTSKPISVTPSEKPQRKQDPIFNAIRDGWGVSKGAFVGKLKKFLLGQFVPSGNSADDKRDALWIKHNLDEGMAVDELDGFVIWYKRKGISFPTSPEVIERNVYEYRETRTPRIRIEPVPEPAAPYEQYTPSETDEAIDFDALINDITEAKRVR